MTITMRGRASSTCLEQDKPSGKGMTSSTPQSRSRVPLNVTINGGNVPESVSPENNDSDLNLQSEPLLVADEQQRSKQVLMAIAPGTCELEVMTYWKILRQFGSVVVVLAIVNDYDDSNPDQTNNTPPEDRDSDQSADECKMESGMILTSNIDIQQALLYDWDMIILPGGYDGCAKMQSSKSLAMVLRRQATLNKLYAASGMAPILVLKPLGLLPPIATCYPDPGICPELNSGSNQLGGDNKSRNTRILDDDVVICNNVALNQGLGSATRFAIELGQCLLQDPQQACSISQEFLIDRTGLRGYRRTYMVNRWRIAPPSGDVEMPTANQDRQIDSNDAELKPSEQPPKLPAHQSRPKKPKIAPEIVDAYDRSEAADGLKTAIGNLRKLPQKPERYVYDEIEQISVNNDGEKSIDIKASDGVLSDQIRKIQQNLLQSLLKFAWTTHKNSVTGKYNFCTPDRAFTFESVESVITFIRQREEWRCNERIGTELAKHDLLRDKILVKQARQRSHMERMARLSKKSAAETITTTSSRALKAKRKFESTTPPTKKPRAISMNDFARLWARLETLNWTMINDKRNKRRYYIKPGKGRHKPNKNEVDYFDTQRALLAYIRETPELNNDDAVIQEILGDESVNAAAIKVKERPSSPRDDEVSTSNEASDNDHQVDMPSSINESEDESSSLSVDC